MKTPTVPATDLRALHAKLTAGDLATVLTRYSDIMLAVVVILLVGIMIIPMPAFLLDFFLATNITMAVTLLMISLYLPNALSLASFPSILLITTLFRLSLNVSSTRLILLKGDAGSVIESFGQFVVAGDFIVGFVIFLIITLVQFLVIAKGAERVSEVGARFTLDALPGKQMSIDADLRSGLIDVTDARLQRQNVQREAQFYGAMDGAMKFVKGDAIAGIIISVINIAAGLAIGVAVKGMAVGAAAEKYTLLTIGDGLVSQIPSLIISMAAGIITTRVASADPNDPDAESSLGAEIGTQILSQPKAIAIAAVMLMLLGAIPGLPMVPFFALAGVTGTLAYSLIKTRRQKELEAVRAEFVEPAMELAGNEKSRLPMTVPVLLEASPEVTPLVDAEGGGSRFTDELVPQMREWLFGELGVLFPGVRVRGDSAHLESHSYTLFVNEVPVARGVAMADRVFVGDNLEQILMLGIEGVRGPHHSADRDGLWLSPEEARQVEQAQGGGAFMQPEEFIVVHLSNVLRRKVDELIGIQDVQNILDLMEQQGFEALVQAVVPRLISVPQLTEIMKLLLAEEISVKNMVAILEALARTGASESDPMVLAEHVRVGLKRYIGFKFSRGRSVVPVYLIDPQIEQQVQAALRKTANGTSLQLAPEASRQIVSAFRDILGAAEAEGPPIVLTQMNVRPHVKQLLARAHPEAAVLSFQELPSDLQLQPVGRITLDQPQLAASPAE